MLSAERLIPQDIKKMKSVLLGLLSVGILLTIGLYIFLGTFSSFDERATYVEISFLSYLVVSVIVSLITALKVGLATSQGRQYLSLFIAMSLFLCAESIWAYFQLVLQIEVPYPSIADVFYLGFIPFIGYHFYYSFSVWQKEKAVKMHSVIIAAIISAVQVGALVYLSFPTDSEEDFDLPSTIISLSYFIGDGALLFVAIVILWSLGRKSVFLLHRILLSSFLIMEVAGDTGFIFHLYLVGEEEFPKLDWVWSMLWSISFVVLVAGLVWYNKISSRINLNIQNVVAHEYPVLESLWNMKGADDGGSNSDLEKDPQLENELTEYVERGEMNQKIINMIEGSKGELALLISIKTIENEINDKILVIAHLIKERSLYCRVLIPRSDKLGELSQEFRNIATAKVQYLYKTLEDSFVLLLGGNSMLRMETVDDASPTDAGQKTFYSNNPQIVLVYETLFENCWVLPMVHETASISQMAVST